jgi:hypothetical protein
VILDAGRSELFIGKVFRALMFAPSTGIIAMTRILSPGGLFVKKGVVFIIYLTDNTTSVSNGG